MNIFLFALAAWVCLGLEFALPPVLDAGSGGVHPSFVIPLLVFVALHAETRAAMWSAVALGLLMDLLTPVALIDGGSAVIPGPHAIGFLLATQMTLAMRSMVIRHNPLTLVVLSIVGVFTARVGVVALIGLRSAFDDAIVWRGARELVPGFWSALYTALSALVMSFPLFAATPLFGFPHPHAPRFSRRD
ncbi:MAG: hypothetical protein D6692_10710 [Planctomycetota bacterium]|nr:MAG: hypothetical protein D6692_10710 [Planctomycetota bacterium]